MRLVKRWADAAHGTGAERGSASLEFIVTGLILLVPLVYLVLTMAQLQAGALGVEGAARQAARVYVAGDSIADASARAERAIEITLTDYGIDPETARVEVTCSPQPSNCLARRGFVTVSIEVIVALPLAPEAVRGESLLAVPLDASATHQVSRFRSTP